MRTIFHCLLILIARSCVESSSSPRLFRPSTKKVFYDVLQFDPKPNHEISPGPSPRAIEDARNARDRISRYLGDNNIICETEISKGVFFEDGYEFFPSEYINKSCVASNADPFKIESNGIRKPEVCLHNDNEFGCQTLYEELNVLKKNTRNKYECWEHETQLVAVGCKCNIHFKY